MEVQLFKIFSGSYISQIYLIDSNVPFYNSASLTLLCILDLIKYIVNVVIVNLQFIFQFYKGE